MGLEAAGIVGFYTFPIPLVFSAVSWVAAKAPLYAAPQQPSTEGSVVETPLFPHFTPTAQS